jgi:hypothetical protein
LYVTPRERALNVASRQQLTLNLRHRNGGFVTIVLKKSASGAEIIGGWFAPEAADRLRRVAAVPASG